MRILVLCYEAPPVGGGGGRVALQIGAGLAARGHVVRYLTSHVAGLEREEVVDGVAIRRRFAGRKLADRCTVPEMLFYVLTHLPAALVECLRFRPDVIHVHFAVPTGPVAWFATRLTRTPYVLTVHLGDVPGGVPEQTDRLFRFVKPFTVPIWKAAARVTAVSRFVADLARKAYGIAPEIIHNGVAMGAGPATGPAPAPADGPLRMIWVGRMQQQKNLIAGVRDLAATRQAGWRLDMVGDGPDRAAVEAVVREHGLTERVTFHGWREQREVAALMDSADLLFLPSTSEGLSMATVEALRHGLAFVASRIPGVDDVVEDGANGLLCDPAETGSFARAVDVLAADRGRLEAMKTASHARRFLFEIEHMVDAYERTLAAAADRVRR